MKTQSETREEKMSQIQEKLISSTTEIFSSGKYEEYIKTMAKFPQYSINNCILIASQCPTATLVCGYKKWQTEFNRTVNKNEHGIMILAPIKRKMKVKELLFDENQHPILDERGKQKTEEVMREYSSFHPVYVFDYQQTSGDPLPSLVSLLDQTVDGYDLLRKVLEEISPVPISFEKMDVSANGYYSPKEQRIVIKEGLSELQTVKTMIHEIAHATFGHGGKEDKWDKKTKEVQAESVAYWVTSMLGLDTSEYSFGYIAGWSSDKEVTELKENLEIIKSTADKLSDEIESRLRMVELVKDESKETCAETSEEMKVKKRSR